MKRNKIDLNEEREIIINMIVSDQFLKEIHPIVRSKLFKSSYAKIICNWIVEYYQRYKEAPKKNIQEIYNNKKKSLRDSDESDLISSFLKNLSDDYSQNRLQNVLYSVNNATNYLKLNSLELLRDKIENAISESNPLIGEQTVSNYKRVEFPTGEGISILRDSASVSDAFIFDDESLFRFPSALGKVCGDFLRGDLVSFLGAPGRGKTWWLLYTAIRAATLGLKSVFFTLEMSKPQIIRRAWMSLLGQPKETCDLEIPELVEGGEKEFYLGYLKKEKPAVDISEITSKQKSFRSQLRSGDVRIIQVPAYSTTVEEIEAHLDNMEHYDNFKPDSVVIDYADIVAPPKNIRGDYRHQIDGIWKKLKGLAQERNILVVTASQTDRNSLKKDANEWNVAEDIRKFAHVSKMMVLNQSKEEYEKGIMRIRQLKERDGRKDTRQVVVLQCLDIGRPYLDSCFDYEVEY